MDWKFEEGRIYSTDEKGELMAEATYVFKENGDVDIDHTFVNPVLRGQGVAGKMMEIVAEFLRGEGLRATATCSYANLWFKKNAASNTDILSEELDSEAIACKIDGAH